MLNNTDNLFASFEEIVKESRKTSGETIENIRMLIFDVSSCFSIGIEKVDKTKYLNSLVFWSYMESIRISGHILFLTANGLYRNAFDDIRHLLESIVQVSYVEANHPNCDFNTKLEVLKEIEDKKEYHARRLIEEKQLLGEIKCKGIDCKGLLKNEYVALSQIVHPSHEKLVSVIKDVKEHQGIPATVKPEEIAKVFDSLRKTYDIYFFVIFANFPEMKLTLEKETKIKDYIKKYDLAMLDKILASIKA